MNPVEIQRELLPGGRIAGKLRVYEERDSQLNLLSLIVKSFNENSLAAAEAGTGVGKSFAYLVPAFFFVLENKKRKVRERVVISTATINLQQQLFEKDIPFVLSVLDENLKTVLVKGRGNYLCLRRLFDAVNDAGFFKEDERENLQKIIDWSKETKTGAKTELPFDYTQTVWQQVASEADSCAGKKCPYFDQCFVQEVRKEAAQADVLVVNHHVLFADIAARENAKLNEGSFVLPPWNRLIIDEAHNIENAATSFFSGQFSQPGLLRIVNRLYRSRRGMPQGFLAAALNVLSIEDDQQIKNKLQNLREASADLTQSAVNLCGYDNIRISPKISSAVDAIIIPNMIRLKNALDDFMNAAFDYAKKINDLSESEDGDESLYLLAFEINTAANRLNAISNIANEYINWQKNTEDVLWIEKRSGFRNQAEQWAVFNVTPLETAGRLKNALWEKAETAICVSATLTVAGSFDYFFHQSGIDITEGKTMLKGVFPSPFPYQKSVLLACPSDAPLPNEESYRAFVNEASAKLCEISGGRALALFTSYESMNSAYNYAEPFLRDLQINCYKQGGDDRAKLLEKFKAENSSVLFATDSFWEGIDAPGDTLSLLIIARLPFKMPGDPVFEARCEALDKLNDGGSFMRLSIPEAVMKFRQGFGRLIRTASDRGVVALLDGRLLRKSYGQIFLRSIPETKTVFASLPNLCEAVETFFFP